MKKFQCCFPQGGKSVIVRCRLTILGRHAVFFREESRLFVLFVTPRPVWNVVLFSSGREVFCLNCLSLLDEFGTLCRFLREERLCLSSLNWTSGLTSRCSTKLELRAVFKGKYSSICIVYRRSTNLECRAVFFREEIDFVCL